MRPGRPIAAWICLAWVTLLGACTPVVFPKGEAVTEPTLNTQYLVADDGARLVYRKWMPDTTDPKAVVLAVHGFNDYSNYFDAPGTHLAKTYSIASYAIDQRGFGQSPPEPGVWAGTETYANDVKNAVAALKKQHPGLPVYALGTSMGGGVVMIAATDETPLEVDGVILSAPAVWGRQTMPWYQRLALWIGAHTVPKMSVTGRGLNIKPSDNIEMLIELGKDPLVIKETRIGTIYGLVNLMDTALERSSRFKAPALILYGENDEVIPKRPTALMLSRLPDVPEGKRRIALYEEGYHMLLRDLQRQRVWDDIGSWILNPTASLPSGADLRDPGLLSEKR